MADDMAIIDTQRRRVIPGANALRLRGQARAIEIASGAELIEGRDDKYCYRVQDARIAPSATTLGAIVALTPDPDAPTTGQIEELSGVRALVRVLEQAFDVSAPTRSWASRRMALARALVERAPRIISLRYSRDPHGAPRHVDALKEVIAW